EAVLAAVRRLDRGAAVAGEDVDDLLVEMFLRRGLRARAEIEHEDRNEVAAALEMGDGTLDAEARPWRGRDCEQIDAEILGQRHRLLVAPGEIGVDEELRMFRQRPVHCRASLKSRDVLVT